MIPEGITLHTQGEEPGNRTWEVDFAQGRIRGLIDGITALKQTIRLLVITEYQYSEIYTEFGLKTVDLMGRDFPLIASEFKRRVEAALLKDDRVLEVREFAFAAQSGGSAYLVSFVVDSRYGELPIQEEVIL